MNDTILYIYDQKFSVEQRLRGVFVFARTRGWLVERVEASRANLSMERLAGFWHAQGAIVEGGLANPTDYAPSVFGRLRLPVVYCDDGESEFRGRRTSVRHDSRETTMTATRALLDLHLPHYAYIGTRVRRDWSQTRQRTFLEMVRAAGATVSVCDPTRPAPSPDITVFMQRLSAFLLKLPRPCGLLAANDETACRVMRAAVDLGIVIPDEMPIIGIDDDRLLCENTVPTLASIAPDFERSGELAARLLAERMDDPGTPHRTVLFGAAPLTPRQSLRRFVHKDAPVIKALEFIRLNACSGLRVDDIVATTGLSRRSFEMRFEKLVGRSVQDEIEAVRFRTASDLLARTHATIDAIAQQCGYAGASSLLHLFRKVAHTTPAEWRQQHYSGRESADD